MEGMTPLEKMTILAKIYLNKHTRTDVERSIGDLTSEIATNRTCYMSLLAENTDDKSSDLLDELDRRNKYLKRTLDGKLAQVYQRINDVPRRPIEDTTFEG